MNDGQDEQKNERINTASGAKSSTVRANEQLLTSAFTFGSSFRLKFPGKISVFNRCMII